jgi:2-polyprenyl-3-methyl-5-hydroxy-6-metoxy-1,4-benzoquinol methylase
MPIIREYQKKDDIVVFDTDLDHRSTYGAEHLENLWQAEQTHFWFAARREKICRAFHQHVDKKSSILEIGGGTGFVAAELHKQGFSVAMADIHLNGLNFAKEKGIKTLYQFDLFRPPFQQEFDVICLFDVLEHLEDDQLALKCLQSMLKPGGKIILTVPAHQWLWCQDDETAGHRRRYTKKSLTHLFATSGWKIISIQYFFMAILPFLLLRKFLKKDSGKPIVLPLPKLFNKILYSVTKAEFYLDKFFPNRAGGSLLAVAQAPI